MVRRPGFVVASRLSLMTLGAVIGNPTVAFLAIAGVSRLYDAMGLQPVGGLMVQRQRFLRMTRAALVGRGDAVVTFITSCHLGFISNFCLVAMHKLSVTIYAHQLAKFCVRGVGNNQIAGRRDVSLKFMADVAILIHRLGVKTGNIAVALA